MSAATTAASTAQAEGPGRAVRVLVWNEAVHEAQGEPASMAEDYPDGIHGAVAAAVREHLPAAQVTTAVLADPEHGLTEEALAATDVLVWWGHRAHAEVSDAAVDRVQAHVLGGMGLVALHSAHFSKPFTRLLGTTCSLGWRNDDEREAVWTVDPAHPVAAGVPNPFVIDHQEVYVEPFDVPPPDDLVFVSGFTGGEVFRSGMGWRRGRGRVFYFSPGDQDYPVYHHPAVRRVVANAVAWADPGPGGRAVPAVWRAPREDLTAPLA